MSSAAQAAAQLRSVVPQMPTGVIRQIEDDLEAVTELVAEVLHTSSRRDDVLGALRQIRSALAAELTDLVGAATRAVQDKAAELATETTPAAPAAPIAIHPDVEAMRSRPNPKTSDKDVNKLMGELRRHGYGFTQRRGGQHIGAYGPDGRRSMTISSTPSDQGAMHMLRRKLRELNDKDERGTE